MSDVLMVISRGSCCNYLALGFSSTGVLWLNTPPTEARRSSFSAKQFHQCVFFRSLPLEHLPKSIFIRAMFTRLPSFQRHPECSFSRRPSKERHPQSIFPRGTPGEHVSLEQLSQKTFSRINSTKHFLHISFSRVPSPKQLIS